MAITRQKILEETKGKYINFNLYNSDQQAIEAILYKMDYKINFNAHKSGVHNLEVYYGVEVPHNFSATKSYHYVENSGHIFYILRFSSGFMNENFLFLPPSGLDRPYGLVPELEYLFWKNKEHIISFSDTREWHVSVSWDIKNGEAQLTNSDNCRKSNSSHHLNFCEWPKQVSNPSIDGAVIVNAGHYIDLYQHFYDNAQPHNAISLLTTGLSPKDVTIYTQACGNLVHQMQDHMGYKSQVTCQGKGVRVSAKRLILAAVVRVCHPWYFDWFTSLMDLPELKRDKIILLPRGGIFGGKGERIIDNLIDLVEPLSKIYGRENIIVFNKDDLFKFSNAWTNIV